MSIHRRPLFVLGASALVTLVAACGGGGSGSTYSGAGSVKVLLTDAPACGYDEVNVTVEKIAVNQSAAAGDQDTSWFEVAVNADRPINLLDLQNGVLAELGNLSLPAGNYAQLRLVLASGTLSGGAPANSVVLSDDPAKTKIALRTPSAQQSGLKLRHSFDVAAGASQDIVLDFDACRSVVRAGGSGNYNLKPVLSVIPIAVAGKIEVGGSLGAEGAGAAISAQIVGPDGKPQVVRSTTADGLGAFVLSPIPESGTGTYTLIITKSGYATHVITDVPATAGTLTTLPLMGLEAANNALIEGVITLSTSLQDAQGVVRAIQTLGDGIPGVEVASAPMAITGPAGRAYALTVANRVIRQAAYSGSALSFADVPAPVAFEIEARLSDEGTAAQSAQVALSEQMTSAASDFEFLEP